MQQSNPLPHSRGNFLLEKAAGWLLGGVDRIEEVVKKIDNQIYVERSRWFLVTMYTAGVAVFAGCTIIVLTFGLIVLFWNEGRMLAIGSLMALYALMALFFYNKMVKKMRNPRTMNTSISELEKDRQSLSRRHQ